MKKTKQEKREEPFCAIERYLYIIKYPSQIFTIFERTSDIEKKCFAIALYDRSSQEFAYQMKPYDKSFGFEYYAKRFLIWDKQGLVIVKTNRRIFDTYRTVSEEDDWLKPSEIGYDIEKWKKEHPAYQDFLEQPEKS